MAEASPETPLTHPQNYFSQTRSESSSVYYEKNTTTEAINTALLLSSDLPLLHPSTPQESCSSRAYKLLRDLMPPLPNSCIFRAEEASTPADSSQPGESIESILFKTDAAIEHASSILQCHCHTSSSVRYALNLVLLDVISWYELLVKRLHEPERQKPSLSSSSDNSGDEAEDGECDSDASTMTSNHATVEIAMSSIRVGGMELNQSDAVSLIGNLIFLRTKRVRGMVLELVQR